MSDFGNQLVNSGPQACLIIPSSEQEATLVYNPDPVNTVWLSSKQSFTIGNSDSVPLGPLATVTVFPGHETFASTLPGITVTLDLAPAWAVTASPSAIAEQIALSGIGLLNNSKNLLNTGSVSVPLAGLVYNINGITGTGYDIHLLVSASLTANMSIEFQWTDPASGLIVDDQLWWVWPGSTLHSIIGHGPVAGGNLTVIFTAFTNPCTIDLLFFQNSRPLTRHDWRSQIWTNSTFAGNLATNSPINGVIAANSHGLATGTGTTYNLPLFAGRCKIIGVTGSNTTDGTFQILNLADTSAVGNNVIWRGVSNAQGYVSDYVTLPRTQCQVALTNHNAGTQTLSVGITAEEY